MNTALTCSMTPGTTASQSCVDPLSTMSSLATATAAGVGSSADASPVNIAMVKTTAAARAPRASLGAIMNSVLPAVLKLRPLDDAHAVRAGDDRGLGQPDEQTMLDDAGNLRKPIGKQWRLDDPRQRRVENEVTRLRDESMAVPGPPQADGPGRAGSRRGALDRTSGCRKPERHHFDEQRAASPLDQRQVRSDLVGTVDREVEFGRLVEGRQRQPQPLGVGAGGPGGRHPDDVEPGAHAIRQQLDEVFGGRAGAQPEAHAGLDEFERRGGGLALVIFRVHGGSATRIMDDREARLTSPVRRPRLVQNTGVPRLNAGVQAHAMAHEPAKAQGTALNSEPFRAS